MALDNIDQQNNYYKLSSVVEQCLLDNGLKMQYFQKFLSWAIWGLRELKLDTAQDVKTELITVSERKTVAIPDGFVDWVKIGIPTGQYVQTLAINDDLRLDERGFNPSILTTSFNSKPNGLEATNYGGYYFMNFQGSSFIGVGSGLQSKGHFNIVNHDGCKEILLDYDVYATQIYLEYITDGLNYCGETILDPYLMDYTLKYIEMKREAKLNPNKTRASVEAAEEDVYWASRKVRARKNNLDRRTLLMMSRKEARLTPKL